MKHKMFKTLVLAGVLALSGAAFTASAGQSLRVNVPFSFVVAGQQFSAGDYRIAQTDSGLIIVQGAGQAAAVLSTPGDSNSKAVTGLRFTGNSSREYLVGVQIQGETGRAIPVPAFQERKITLSSR
jgi:hypothetical protein